MASSMQHSLLNIIGMHEVDEPTQEVISPSASIISLELNLRFHLANDLLASPHQIVSH